MLVKPQVTSVSTAEQDHRDCPLCGTAVEPGQDCASIGTGRGSVSAHRECLLREVLGGIGHLTGHAYWCGARHDPDGGMTRRESALAVDHWVHVHGVAAAAAIPDGSGHGEGMSVGGAGLQIPADWVDDSL